MMPRFIGCLAGGLALASSVVACSSDDPKPPGNPSTGGSAGAGTVAGSGGTAAGSGGSVATGGGGSGTTAGASGAAGSSGGGVGGGGTNAGGAGGSAGGTGGGAGMPCPADKTFCAGFEDAALPEGAAYESNGGPGEWTRDFQIDTAVFRSGKSSVKLVNPGTGQLRMLRVAAPAGGKFWARFYIRQAGADIGDLKHNVFAGASWTTDANTKMIEFAEDVGVAINVNDKVRWPMGFGRLNDGSTKPFTLPKDQWHCIELSFDGVARVQQVYVEGELKIDATDFPEMVPMPLAFFRFGFQALNGPARDIWYDDVAVGPTRPGCLPK